MSGAYTKGPWVLKEFGGPQISGPNGYAVCTMWGALSVDKLRGRDLANAHLIAAAPMLFEGASDTLEALQNLRAGIVSGVRSQKLEIELIDAHIAELEFALARAKGTAA